MTEWSQSFTLTKDVDRGFNLCPTSPTQWTVWQPHWVKMSPQGIMSSEKASNSPGLCPVKGQKPSLGTQTGLGFYPEINSRACLWVSPRPRHHIEYWLTNQCLILLISCLETPKASSGRTNFKTEPSRVSSLAISLPRTPACPGTQYSPTACQVDVSFHTFWQCWTNGDFVLTAWRAFKAAWLSESIHGSASVIHMIINSLSKVRINNNSKLWCVPYKNIPSPKMIWFMLFIWNKENCCEDCMHPWILSVGRMLHY
jgi:hypothetical protein